MTKVAIISTNDHVYGVNKSLELLGINPIKGKDVVFKPNFNTADPFPASSSMEIIKQLIIRLREMGAKSITVAERSGPAKTFKTFEKVGLYSLANEIDFKIVNLEDIPHDDYVLKQPEGSHWKAGFLFAKIYDDAECVIETCCHKFLTRFILLSSLNSKLLILMFLVFYKSKISFEIDPL